MTFNPGVGHSLQETTLPHMRVTHTHTPRTLSKDKVAPVARAMVMTDAESKPENGNKGKSPPMPFHAVHWICHVTKIPCPIFIQRISILIPVSSDIFSFCHRPHPHRLEQPTLANASDKPMPLPPDWLYSIANGMGQINVDAAATALLFHYVHYIVHYNARIFSISCPFFCQFVQFESIDPIDTYFMHVLHPNIVFKSFLIEFLLNYLIFAIQSI